MWRAKICTMSSSLARVFQLIRHKVPLLHAAWWWWYKGTVKADIESIDIVKTCFVRQGNLIAETNWDWKELPNHYTNQIARDKHPIRSNHTLCQGSRTSLPGAVANVESDVRTLRASEFFEHTSQRSFCKSSIYIDLCSENPAKLVSAMFSIMLVCNLTLLHEASITTCLLFCAFICFV